MPHMGEVWVLEITHRHGVDTTVTPSKEAAHEALYHYACDNWGDLFERGWLSKEETAQWEESEDDNPLMPDTPEAVVDCYFSHSEKYGWEDSESYCITPAIIRLPDPLYPEKYEDKANATLSRESVIARAVDVIMRLHDPLELAHLYARLLPSNELMALTLDAEGRWKVPPDETDRLLDKIEAKQASKKEDTK